MPLPPSFETIKEDPFSSYKKVVTKGKTCGNLVVFLPLLAYNLP